MNEIRRVTMVAAFLLVTLRLFIGWQLLYEGLWKINTLRGPNPWSATAYLRNSQGPFRDFFRQMTGDPDELEWLDYDRVTAGWDDWRDRFVKHYQLSEGQVRQLDRLLDGQNRFTAPLENLPAGVDFEELRLHKIVSYDAEKKLLQVNEQHLKPDEKQILLAAVEDETPGADAYRQAVEAVYKRSKGGLSYKEKLRATVRGNPDLLGNEKLQRVGEIDVYKSMLAAYQQKMARADQDFQWDHLNHLWDKIQTRRTELIGPVKALDQDLKERAQNLLSVDQLSRGPVPEPWTSVRLADTLTIAGLTILGALLILGLGTRLAAVLAAAMVFMFYLAMPPWPGVPEVVGPEHSYIVNKNLIEVVALLAIAALPTGRWFGVDGLLGWLWRRRGSTQK